MLLAVAISRVSRDASIIAITIAPIERDCAPRTVTDTSSEDLPLNDEVCLAPNGRSPLMRMPPTVRAALDETRTLVSDEVGDRPARASARTALAPRWALGTLP